MESKISSVELGEMVMERLRERDEVAYVRFVSVYRDFSDIDTFLTELKTMVKGRRKSK
jgi:transcriptional repressor NrdR